MRIQHNLGITKTIYIECINIKRKIYTSATTKLALRDWSYPRHKQIPGYGDDTYYPENPSIICIAVTIYQQEHNAAKISCGTSHPSDKTYDTVSLDRRYWFKGISRGLTVRSRMYMRH